MTVWRIKDQEELDLNPGEEFYIIELKNSSHLFSQAYSSYTEVIQEIQETFGELLPPDFPLDDFLVEIMGEVWGSVSYTHLSDVQKAFHSHCDRAYSVTMGMKGFLYVRLSETQLNWPFTRKDSKSPIRIKSCCIL